MNEVVPGGKPSQTPGITRGSPWITMKEDISRGFKYELPNNKWARNTGARPKTRPSIIKPRTQIIPTRLAERKYEVKTGSNLLNIHTIDGNGIS